MLTFFISIKSFLDLIFRSVCQRDRAEHEIVSDYIRIQQFYTYMVSPV
jgi:hypothetical protein